MQNISNSMRTTIYANYSQQPLRNTSIYNPIEKLYNAYNFTYYTVNGMILESEAVSDQSLKFDLKYSSLLFLNIDFRGKLLKQLNI
jgi:hypothetical protein